MTTPPFPDLQDHAPEKKPLTWQTKAVIAVIVLALVAMIALHAAHVFGP
jgi:hypothetical protein